MRYIAAMVILASCSGALAQPVCSGGFTSDSGFIGADGAASFFTPKVNCGARWDPDGDGPLAEVLVAGGAFGAMDGSPINGIAAWDGRTWIGFGNGLRASSNQEGVNAIVVHNGELYAAGQVGINDTQGNHRVVRWTGTEWVTIGPVFNGSLTSLASFNGNLFVGGDFTISGQQGSDFARWTGAAWLTYNSLNVGPGANNSRVEAMTAHAGDLVISGNFPWRVARFNNGFFQNFGQPVACQFSCSGGVTALLSEGEDLYIAGDFRTVPGQSQPGVMKWDGSTWTPLTLGGQVGARSLTRWNGDLYLCTGTNNSSSSFRRWNGTQWQFVGPQRWYGPTISVVETIGTWEGCLMLGGNFGPLDMLNNGVISSLRAVALYDGEGFFTPSRSVNARVTAMVEWQGETVGVGRFTSAGARRAEYIAIRDAAGFWRPFGPGLNDHAWTACRFGDGVVVGGEFTQAGETSVNHIALWRDGAWHALDGGLDSVPIWMGEVDGQLWAGTTVDAGRFQAFNGLFAWNGSSWAPIPYPAGAWRIMIVGDEVYTSAPDEHGDSRVLRWNGAAFEPLARPEGVQNLGVFTEREGALHAAAVGGAIYRWDGDSWTLAGRLPNSSMGTVSPQNVELEGVVYFGTDVSGGSMQQIWSWDGEAWVSHGQMPLNPQVQSGLISQSFRPPTLHVVDDSVLVGGAFLYTNQNYTNPQSYVARIDPSTRPRTVLAPPDYTQGEVGGQASLTWTVDDAGVSYRWYKDGERLEDGVIPDFGEISGAGTSTLTIANLGVGAGGLYTCYASNPCWNVQLSRRRIYVPAPCDPDFNGDGSADQGDVAALILAIAGGESPAGHDPDFNQDGSADQADVAALIGVVGGAPCP